MTSQEVAELLDVTKSRIDTARHNLGFLHERNSARTVEITEDMLRRIARYIDSVDGNHDKMEIVKNRDMQNRQAEIERLKKEHPLVTDERCFNLFWFPDITLEEV